MRLALAELDRLDFKVPGEGRLSAMLVEYIADIPLDQTCLTDHGLADADDLIMFLLLASIPPVNT